MYLRHMIDTIIMLAIVALFNIQMVSFIGIMNDSLSQADKLLISNNDGINRFSKKYQSLNNDLN